MVKQKRSSDEYIQLKKITKKDLRNAILVISKELMLTPQELCYKYISEGVVRDKKR